MRTAEVRSLDDVVIRETSLWPLADDEIRLRVMASGVCGTDVANARKGFDAHKPFGHEVAGVVLETGRGVKNVKVGQKVALESASACGVCLECKNTRQELCTDIKSFFHKTSFGMAEEMISPAISAIPDDLPADVACLSEPLGVAIDLVRLADVRLDSNVLVIGPGPIGLMAVALAKRMGARKIFVSGYSKHQRRLAVAERFGADGIILSDKTPLASFPFGCGIDRILVTAPPPVLNDAFAVACKGAVISFIGIGHGEAAFCRFDANAFHFKKLQLRASFASPALYSPLALQYLREKVVDGNALISHRFPLADTAQALKTAADSAASIKVVVMP